MWSAMRGVARGAICKGDHDQGGGDKLSMTKGDWAMDGDMMPTSYCT